MTTIDNCPFCGSDVYYEDDGGVTPEHRMICTNANPDIECGVAVWFSVDMSKEEAIRLWNRRETSS